jgi:hypothetical protein
MALYDCQEALKINPEFTRAYKRISKCHLKLG